MQNVRIVIQTIQLYQKKKKKKRSYEVLLLSETVKVLT